VPDRTWFPYAPDQGFGAGIAADEELLDRTVAGLDARRLTPPSAANTAPRTGSVDRPVAGWLALGAGVEDPVTTAAALDAAPLMGPGNG
jgi:hypothetical protein